MTFVPPLGPLAWRPRLRDVRGALEHRDRLRRRLLRGQPQRHVPVPGGALDRQPAGERARRRRSAGGPAVLLRQPTHLEARACRPLGLRRTGATAARLRFRMNSDGFTVFDGFDFDSLRIEGLTTRRATRTGRGRRWCHGGGARAGVAVPEPGPRLRPARLRPAPPRARAPRGPRRPGPTRAGARRRIVRRRALRARLGRSRRRGPSGSSRHLPRSARGRVGPGGAPLRGDRLSKAAIVGVARLARDTMNTRPGRLESAS